MSLINHKRHLQSRIKMRFGIIEDMDILQEELIDIICTDNEPIFIEKQKKRSQFIIIYRNEIMRVIYDGNKGVVVTVMKLYGHDHINKYGCEFIPKPKKHNA